MERQTLPPQSSAAPGRFGRSRPHETRSCRGRGGTGRSTPEPLPRGPRRRRRTTSCARQGRRQFPSTPRELEKQRDQTAAHAAVSAAVGAGPPPHLLSHCFTKHRKVLPLASAISTIFLKCSVLRSAAWNLSMPSISLGDS